MLNEIEKELVKKTRYVNISSQGFAIKGWLWYEIDQELLPLSQEEIDVIKNSKYLEFDLVFSSLLGKEVESLRILSEKLNSAIRLALAEDPELTWRDLGVPLWYWRSEIK